MFSTKKYVILLSAIREIIMNVIETIKVIRYHKIAILEQKVYFEKW